MTPDRDLPEADREFGFETRQLHAGQRPDPNTGARAVPIFQTTSYVFEDPESAGAYFNLQEYGNTYSRIMNPTVAVFEERVANLEGGAGGVAFASGIAAQAAALFTLLEPGDHIVSSAALYGGTVNQFKHLLRKMSVELTWVDPDDPDEWRKAVELNLMSTVHLAKAVIPYMQRHRWGRIIAITSISVKQPIADLVLSNSVRAAVVGLVKSLSNEFGKDGILVNNVAPGYTATERLQELAQVRALVAGCTPQQVCDSWASETPVRRLGDPKEIADVIVWLASERASYVTGQTLLADGGIYRGL